MQKILCIGNSFSQDATSYLETIAQGQLFVRNCFIGGCSLEQHAANLFSNQCLYEYQKDAEPLHMISLQEALQREQWDAVTVQQASWLAGQEDSFEPYLGQLVDEVAKKQPQAQMVFHQTWSYDTGCEHPEFGRYQHDSQKMFTAVAAACERAASGYGLSIIRTGEAVQRARAMDAFQLEKGGISLCRDGCHLSMDYGRYLAGLVWYAFFTGKSACSVTWRPDAVEEERAVQLCAAVG